MYFAQLIPPNKIYFNEIIMFNANINNWHVYLLATFRMTLTISA
jgi:hypothetical protein